MFIETNPIPVKAALAMMGQIEEEYRSAARSHEPEEPRNPESHPGPLRPASQMTRIIIAGAKGAWDRPWPRCAEAVPGLAIAGQFDLGQDLRGLIAEGDVVD